MVGFKKRGLRFELIVSLALLVAAAVGLVGLAVFKFAQQEMMALKIESGLMMAWTIEEKLISSPQGDDLPLLVNALARTGFEGIRVMDQNGKILASSKNWPGQGRPLKEDLIKVMGTGQFRSYTGGTGLLFFGPDPTLTLAVPLYKGSRVVGAVGLFSSLAKLRSSWTRTRWIIYLYVAMDTLVMVLFGGYLLSRRLIHPLSRMLVHVKDLADGSYHPDSDPARG
ncbi:MAG: hypothetical protein JRD68_14150, partial [Deltaproteobacteria bacterium]|nr:hypothetical protein [Deltaproteobacteria bacterium]